MEVIDGRVQQLIEKAILAGAFSVAARRYPDVAEVYRAAADVNSARVARLADQIAMGSVGALPPRIRG